MWACHKLLPSFRARPYLAHHPSLSQFQKAHREWVEAGSSGDITRRDNLWSESIAVGSEEFVEQMKIELGLGAQHREVFMADGLYTLREPVLPYGEHLDRKMRPFPGKQP
jgi:putative transposase